MGVLINEVDVADEFGWEVEEVQGHLNPVLRPPKVQEIAGRDDALYLDEGSPITPRRIVMPGIQKGVDRADFIAKRRALIRHMANRVIDIVFPDQPTLFYRGRVSEFPVVPLRPSLVQRAATLTVTVVCPDPYAYDIEISEIDLGAIASLIPMGDGPVRPIVEIEGPAVDPIVIYKNYLDEEIARFDFTGITLGSGEKRIIDSWAMTVVDENGINRIADYVALTTRWFRFLPSHADLDTETWPKMLLTAGTGTLVYRRAWQ